MRSQHIERFAHKIRNYSELFRLEGPFEETQPRFRSYKLPAMIPNTTFAALESAPILSYAALKSALVTYIAFGGGAG